jgi:hypothetical protein
MKLYICRIKTDSLMLHLLASPEITRAMRLQYQYIQEVDQVIGMDDQVYSVTVTQKKKTTQLSFWEV